MTKWWQFTTFISSVKSLGSRIAIDDFGSGYSNFDTIFKLKIDILKLDGSLVKIIDTDKNAKAIVSTIVAFAKELGLKVVAEYVHSGEVYDELVKMGVDYPPQGFYFSEPLSIEGISQYKNEIIKQS